MLTLSGETAKECDPHEESNQPSTEGSVVAEYAHLSHFRAHIWMT